MRGTRAKQIRKDSLHWNHDNTPALAYTEVKHKPKLMPTGKTNPNGTPEMFQYVPVTVMMSDCERRTYQWFKEGYKASGRVL